MPQAYFEVVGLPGGPRVAYGMPGTDRSLIASASITLGTDHEIVGYDYVASGPSAGFNVVYQSVVYAASLPRAGYGPCFADTVHPDTLGGHVGGAQWVYSVAGAAAVPSPYPTCLPGQFGVRPD